MKNKAQSAFEAVVSVGLILTVFVFSLTVLTWFSSQADASEKILLDNLECEKLATAIDFAWLKEGFTHNIIISKNIVIHSDFIQVGNTFCSINSNPIPVTLNPGKIIISFSEGELIVSN